MKTVKAKPIRSLKPKSAVKKVTLVAAKTVKLNKKDPDYYKKIGIISARKRQMTSDQFSAMAKLSHPRREYKGGRKKIDDDTES